METKSRDAEQVDVEVQLAAYADRLQAYPIVDIERVLSEWPRRSPWWPTWHELAEQLPDMAHAKPLAITYRAPEHRPFAERDAEAHALFGARREWDEFQAALRSLRDPAVPHLAREPLLRIGEAMERRQRPHAEKMGWA